MAKEKKRYVIVRGDRSGVFAGIIQERNGREVILTDTRRIWYWTGAASLSQLAMEGTNSPSTCKFPAPVNKLLLLDAIEIIDTTKKAEKSLRAVPVWRN